MRILGTGSARPKAVLTNDMLSTMVDTNDEWIRSRTGIRSRYIADDSETTISLALEAAEQALAASGIDRAGIGLVICATCTNELRCPSIACSLQRDMGLPMNILAFDLNAACSGFIYSLIVASHFVSPGSAALIVGTEVLSRFTDFTDRDTCVLFGDGAGAAIVVADDAPLPWVAEAKGDEHILSVDSHIHMDGQAVFKFAVGTLAKNVQDVLAIAQLGVDDVALFICHQANERIIAAAAKRLGVPLERFFMNLSNYGNTSAASVPLALDEAVRTGRLHSGDIVVLAGFGGGLTAGAVCFTWN